MSTRFHRTDSLQVFLSIMGRAQHKTPFVYWADLGDGWLVGYKHKGAYEVRLYRKNPHRAILRILHEYSRGAYGRQLIGAHEVPHMTARHDRLVWQERVGRGWMNTTARIVDGKLNIERCAAWN